MCIESHQYIRWRLQWGGFMAAKRLDIKKLWERYKKHPTLNSRNKLIEYYYPLVKKISYKLAERFNWKVEADELMSLGIDGLYRAIDMYDTGRNVKFESYATQRIKGSMIDGLRKEDKVPRSVRMNHAKFEKARSEIETKEGCSVSNEVVAKEIGIDASTYHKNPKKVHPILFASLDHTSLDNSNAEDSDIAQDNNTNLSDLSLPSPDERLTRQEFWEQVVGESFNSIEREIIHCYYYEALTMEEISQRVDLSESRVSQMHKKMLLRMLEKIMKNPQFFSVEIRHMINLPIKAKKKRSKVQRNSS